MTVDSVGVQKGSDYFLNLPLDDLYDSYSIYLTGEEIESHIFKSTLHGLWEETNQLKEIRDMNKLGYLDMY